MYKWICLTISFFIITDVSIGQKEWAPIGTEWYYGYRIGFSPLTDYLYLKSEKDTVINNERLRLLRASWVSETKILVLDDILIQQRGDSILRYFDDGLHLLYNFSAIVGDTVVVPLSENWGREEKILMIVDSVKEVVLLPDSTIIRGQYMRGVDIPFRVDDRSTIFQFNGWHYETIGADSYFVPVNQLDCDGECPWPLRCYFSGNTVFRNVTIPCDTLIDMSVAVKDDYINRKILISPNPARENSIVQIGGIIIGDTKEIRLEIFSMDGRRVYSEILLQRSDSFVMPRVPISGIYIVKLTTDKGIAVKKLYVLKE